MNRTQVPLYAGPAFHHSPPPSALPIPKKFIRSLSGSGAQRDEERPGDKAVPDPSDKSHESKGAVSETERQDAESKVIFTASEQGYIAFENLGRRVNDDDEDDGMGKKQPVLEEDEELQRRQQAIIDNFEAQSTTTVPPIQAAPPEQATITANVQRSAQELQLNWMDQLIRTTAQQEAECLVAYEQSTNVILQLLKKRLELNLARQRELRLQQRLDEIDGEIERGQIRAENEGIRWTGNSNGNDGSGVAGIEGEAGLVARTRQTTMQEFEGITGGNGMVSPKDTKEGEEAEDSMEIGGIDDECFCSSM